MILRLYMAVALVSCGLSTMSAQAEELLLSRDYFDRKIWRVPQALTDDFRRHITLGRFEPMTRYQTGRIGQLGRAVGRLQFLTASGHTSACTGWLIASDQVLTNQHCVAGETPDKQAVQMRLALGALDDRSEADIQLLPVDLPPLESDAALDYAILRVKGDTSRFPPLSLNRIRDPQPEEALFLIGHPGGAPQHITRGGCQVDGRVLLPGPDFAHQCDTLGGNSGSPVFADEDGALVGLHRSGGTHANFAIRMEEIKRRSRILAQLFPNQSIQPVRAAASYPHWKDKVVEQLPTSKFSCHFIEHDYFPSGGIQTLGCHILDIVSMKTLEQIAGVPIFLSGPHSDNLNLASHREFGHYNPRFIEFVGRYVIPDTESKLFIAATQSAYNEYARNIIRMMLAVADKIENEPSCFQKEIIYYKENHQFREKNYLWIDEYFDFLLPYWCDRNSENFKKASNMIKNGDYSRAREIFPMHPLFVKNPQRDPMGDDFDGNIVKSIFAFFMRRYLDGTYESIVQLVMKAAEVYGPTSLDGLPAMK